MMHSNDDDLVLLFYGESDDAGATKAHALGCEECRRRYDELSAVLKATTSALPVPQRGADYGRFVWARLRPALGLKPTERRLAVAPRQWLPVSALAASLVAAFLLGRYSTAPAPQQQAMVPITEKAREHILLLAVGDHFERSQMVLLELVNTQAKGGADISGERALAESLVGATRLYRQTAVRTGDVGVASVLDDLERVLIEVAHSPEQVSEVEMQALRQRIEAEGIIFKVRVMGTKVRERRPAPEPSGNGRVS